MRLRDGPALRPQSVSDEEDPAFRSELAEPIERPGGREGDAFVAGGDRLVESSGGEQIVVGRQREGGREALGRELGIARALGRPGLDVGRDRRIGVDVGERLGGQQERPAEQGRGEALTCSDNWVLLRLPAPPS
jgi:hypothetical protein